MEQLKRRLSFRKKKDHVPECSKPHQWQEDERKVRDGTCSFQVRYLGYIEVFESRGIQVCEEAVKALKAQCKGKYQRAILYVSGDAVRVVDEISKGLIVDQTIEKVSFCAPDRNHEKGFAYICRDGTTRRWMCHGFLALKESGERLSHAVGCAFALCLEKKQKREKDSVSVTFNQKGTSFTRTGSFRQTTMTERLVDPQSAIIAEPVPLKDAENPFAVERPRPSDQMLQRQGSFRGFEKLSESSPFKRQMSLRLNELPSTLERQQVTKQGSFGPAANGPAVSPIPEASPTKEQQEAISDLCQQLTQGLSALSTEDPFGQAPGAATHQTSALVHNTPAQQQQEHPHGIRSSLQSAQPIQQSNPWASPPPYVGGKVSDAEFWLSSTATSVTATGDPFETAATTTTTAPTMNGTTNNNVFASPAQALTHQQLLLLQQQQQQQQQQFAAQQRAPHISHLRSHSIDTAEMSTSWFSPTAQKGPTLREISQRQHVAQFQSQQNGTAGATTTAAKNPWNSSPPRPRPGLSQDPFDAAWAAKASTQPNTNPFQGNDNVTKAFEVKL